VLAYGNASEGDISKADMPEDQFLSVLKEYYQIIMNLKSIYSSLSYIFFAIPYVMIALLVGLALIAGATYSTREQIKAENDEAWETFFIIIRLMLCLLTGIAGCFALSLHWFLSFLIGSLTALGVSQIAQIYWTPKSSLLSEESSATS
jgi:hypothetical protein